MRIFLLILILAFNFFLIAKTNHLSLNSLKTSYEGLIIKKIIISNNHSVNDFKIKSYLEIKEKDVFDQQKIKNSFKKLYRSQFFRNIDFYLQVLEDNDAKKKLHLLITVEEQPIIDEIKFIGNKNFSASDLLSSIEENFSQFTDDNVFYSKTLLQFIRNFILQKYQEDGFLLTSVNYREEMIAKKNKVNIIFDIQENTKIIIGKINFIGNTNLKSQSLLGIMENREKHWFNDGKFTEMSFAEDKEKIVYFYQTKGFIDAKITDTTIQYQWKNPQKKDTRELKITIEISEGKKYYFGDIEIRGHSIFTDLELKKLIKRQKEKVFNQQIHDQEIQDIYNLYRGRGYIFTRITPLEEITSNRQINYVLDIYEGDKAHIENIFIRGLKKTKEKVVRRELLLREGEIFDVNKLRNSVDRITRLNFFTPPIQPDYRIGSTEGLMNLVFSLEEQLTGNIGGGISWGSVSGPSIHAEIKENNFNGLGQVLGAKIQYGENVKDIALNFTEPRLFDTQIGLGVNLTIGKYYYYYFTENSQTIVFPNGQEKEGTYNNAILYTRDTLSAGFSINYNFWRWLSTGAGYNFSLSSRYLDNNPFLFESFSQQAIYDHNSDKFTSSPEENDTGLLLHTITFALRWDSRNNVFSPSRGLNVGLQWRMIYGDYSIYRWKFDLNFYQTIIKPLIFAYSLELKTLTPDIFGRYDYDTANYYIIFPEQELRGWSSSSIGTFRESRSPTQNFSYSYGQSTFRQSLELRFPIYFPYLWLAGFIDSVTLDKDGIFTENLTSNNGFDTLFNVRDYMHSIGLGVQLHFPQLPIRIYYAWPFVWDKVDNRIVGYNLRNLWGLEWIKEPVFVFTILGLF